MILDALIINIQYSIVVEEKHFKIDDYIWNDPFFEIKDLSNFTSSHSGNKRKDLWTRYSGKNTNKGIKMQNISNILYDLVRMYIHNQRANSEIPPKQMIKKQLKMKHNSSPKKRNVKIEIKIKMKVIIVH